MRITIQLTMKATACLQHLVRRTGQQQTAIVNQALALYELVDSEISQGAKLVIRRDGREQEIKLL
jgi:hypothetical protein